MKITLDFDLKTITVDEDVNLNDLYKQLKSTIPDWKEWSLKQEVFFYYYTGFEIPSPYPTYNTNQFYIPPTTYICDQED